MAEQQGLKASVANADAVPVVKSIFDFSAEALGELKSWLEANPPSIPISQIVGFSLFQQRCFLNRSVGQSVASGAYTLLTWDVEAQDTGGFHGPGNLNRITIPAGQDGQYLVGAFVPPLFTVFTGNSELVLTKNAELAGGFSSTGVLAAATLPIFSGAAITHTVVIPQKLVGGDYLSLSLFQGSGAAATVPDPSYSASGFWCIRVG